MIRGTLVHQQGHGTPGKAYEQHSPTDLFEPTVSDTPNVAAATQKHKL